MQAAPRENPAQQHGTHRHFTAATDDLAHLRGRGLEHSLVEQVTRDGVGIGLDR